MLSELLRSTNLRQRLIQLALLGREFPQFPRSLLISGVGLGLIELTVREELATHTLKRWGHGSEDSSCRSLE